MAVMAHTQGVCLLVVCLEYSRHSPCSLWQSEEHFALGEEEREQILISYFAGENIRACLSFFPTESYSRTLLKPLWRQEGNGSVCCCSVLIRSSLTKSKAGVTRNSWMLRAQDDLKTKRFRVKKDMVLLNPGSHRWPCLSSGHKTKPKDVCVRKGRRGKVTRWEGMVMRRILYMLQ